MSDTPNPEIEEMKEELRMYRTELMNRSQSLEHTKQDWLEACKERDHFKMQYEFEKRARERDARTKSSIFERLYRLRSKLDAAEKLITALKAVANDL